jgi:alpha-galactosidase
MNFKLITFLLLFVTQSYGINYQKLHLEYEKEDDTEITLTVPFLKQFENEDLKIWFEKTETEKGAHYRVLLQTKKPIEIDGAKIKATIDTTQYGTYFCNGFQSWTTSKEFFPNEKIGKPAALGKAIAKYYGDYTYFKYKARKGNIHSWTYTYLRNKAQDKITLLASVAEFSGFTIFSYQLKKGLLKIIKEINDLEVAANTTYNLLEWVEAHGEEYEAFNWYAEKNFENVENEAARKGFSIKKSIAKPEPGWTSWYNYYRNIVADTILKNLNAFKQQQIPIGIFQIDDGFQKSVGEWTQTNEKFPDGMKPIADAIHINNVKAGLWLAPFIIEKKSLLYETKKDWLLKNDKGKPIKAGYNPLWSGWYYPLNIYNQEVQQYLKNTFDTVLNHQGYDMVKLDFLFAACINPPADKTRGEMMFDGMLMLREWCGDKFILGCGVPLGTAFHLVDYCRVSSDIHMKWEQKVMKAMDMRERVSVWSTITSNIGRRHLNGTMFLNDPDVFVLREENNKLKWNEKVVLFQANNLFGSLVFTSDNIGNYNSEALQLYKSKFPFQSEKKLNVLLLEKDVYQIEREDTKSVIINLENRTFQQ